MREMDNLLAGLNAVNLMSEYNIELDTNIVVIAQNDYKIVDSEGLTRE